MHDDDTFTFTINGKTIIDSEEGMDPKNLPKFILSDGIESPAYNDHGDIVLGITRALGLLILSSMMSDEDDDFNQTIKEVMAIAKAFKEA